MPEITYIILGALAFAILNAAWFWLFKKVQARRAETELVKKRAAVLMMPAKFRFRASGH